jgi:hypothetical protein
MGTINELNTTDTLAGDDKLVIWKDQAGATRAITAEDAATYFSIAGGPYQPEDELLTAIAALGPSTAAGDFIEVTAQDAVRVRKLSVATYAALTLIPAAFRFDDMLVYVASRAADGDGAEGYWRFDAASSATANAGTILAPDAGTGRWVRQYTGAVYAEWFGAKGDGTTDDTVAIQATLTMLRLVGGGIAQFLPDRTYMFSAPMRVGSNTWVRGGGWTTIFKATDTFVTPAWNSYSDPTPGGMSNYNFQSSTIVDENIWFSDFKSDFNVAYLVATYSQANAFIFLRKVRGFRVHNVWATDCSNGTAIIACEDGVTTDMLVTRIANAGIDHWEGSKRCKVSNCTVLGWCDANFDYTAPPAGITPVQGIQFTGTGTFADTSFVTEDVTAIGNTVKFFPATNASGIIANANGTLSRVDNARFIANDVEDCNLPVVFSGLGSGHVAAHNRIHDSTGAGIYASQTAFSSAPTGVQIIGNYFKNVTTTVGVGQVLIGSNGNDGYYEGNVAEGCTYAHGFFFDGDDNQIGQQNIPDGTSSVLIDDTGSGNTYGQIRQAFDVPAVLEFGGASVGITSSLARLDYIKIGKSVNFMITIFLTSKGSSAGVAEIELGYGALVRSSGSIGYFENFAGPPTLMNWVIDANGTVLRIFKNTTTAATNADFQNDSALIISGSYITNQAG